MEKSSRGRKSRSQARKANVRAAEWAVADGKARFSELIAKAADAPQTITRNGQPVAVLVGIEQWRRKTERKGNLADFFLSSPLRGSGIDLERLEMEPRDVEL